MISIEIVERIPSAATVSAVRAVTAISVAAIRRAIERGAPIYQTELSRRPRDETFTEIRRLIAGLEQLGLSLRIEENGRQISSENLLNILRSSEDSAERARELDDLGHA